MPQTIITFELIIRQNHAIPLQTEANTMQSSFFCTISSLLKAAMMPLSFQQKSTLNVLYPVSALTAVSVAAYAALYCSRSMQNFCRVTSESCSIQHKQPTLCCTIELPCFHLMMFVQGKVKKVLI